MDKPSAAARLTAGLGSLAAMLLAVAALAAQPQKGWTITSLGALPSQRHFSTAEAINNAGDVVGWSTVFDPAANADRAYAILWRDGEMLNLGEGSALSINQHGTVAGSVVGGLSLWKDGQWTHLGMGGAPNGINKFEDIAGWEMGGQNHAYLYKDGVLFDLGTLGGATSTAEAINDRGQVAGWAQVASGGNDHAFLFEDGVMKDLGTLEGGFVSRAHDVNNRGVVVGEAWQANGNSIPFIYDGTMRRMFQTTDCCVVPRAINDHGAVVGTTNGNASFVYDDGVVTRLESIPAVQAAGWTQLIPNDINDRGWIVGMGRKGPLVSPAQQEWFAFVLKPPA
jgi:probable HAF family extracellular repeat protein